MNRVLSSATKLAVQASKRKVSSSTARMTQERVDISHIKKAQRHFQIDDGTPIYLKGGIPDKLLFSASVVLAVFGLGYSATVIYELAMPPKN